MNPCKFMFVVVQMNDTAVWNRSKLIYKRPVNFALHLYRTNHVLYVTACKPLLHPLEQTLRIADDVAEHPIKFSKFIRCIGKCIMRFKRHKGIFHKRRSKRRPVNRKNFRTQIHQHIRPAAGTCTCIEATASFTWKRNSKEMVCKRKTFLDFEISAARRIVVVFFKLKCSCGKIACRLCRKNHRMFIKKRIQSHLRRRNFHGEFSWLQVDVRKFVLYELRASKAIELVRRPVALNFF